MKQQDRENNSHSQRQKVETAQSNNDRYISSPNAAIIDGSGYPLDTTIVSSTASGRYARRRLVVTEERNTEPRRTVEVPSHFDEKETEMRQHRTIVTFPRHKHFAVDEDDYRVVEQIINDYYRGAEEIINRTWNTNRQIGYMSVEAVRNKIEVAEGDKHRRVFKLRLPRSIKILPPNAVQLGALAVLDLSFSNVSELPSWIGNIWRFGPVFFHYLSYIICLKVQN